MALLAAPGIGLFVLAVEPEIFSRRGLIGRCIAVGVGVAALLYLELPLRAGPFRAPIVYGHPETLIGFAYVVFGTQFSGDLASPIGSLGRGSAAWPTSRRASSARWPCSSRSRRSGS